MDSAMLQMAAQSSSGGSLSHAEGATAISGHLPPAYGIDPQLTPYGEHIIPKPLYDPNSASGGFMGIGGVGKVGGSIDQTFQTTASIIDGPLLGAIRKAAAFTRNFIDEVANGTILSPGNINPFAQVQGMSHELSKMGLQHVGIGEQIHAMSGLGVIGQDQQGQSH